MILTLSKKIQSDNAVVAAIKKRWGDGDMSKKLLLNLIAMSDRDLQD